MEEKIFAIEGALPTAVKYLSASLLAENFTNPFKMVYKKKNIYAYDYEREL
jgi:hypothetical protein